MKRIFILAIIALYFCGANKVIGQDFSSVYNGKTIYYDITSFSTPMTVEVANYYLYSGSIDIPSSVIYNGNTYSVTSIGIGAFGNCSNLISVTIPNSVTSINNYAFTGCNNLTSITIPSPITSIGDGAFFNCSGLTIINFNATNCTNIGINCWYGCTSSITLNIGNSVQTIPNDAFRMCSGLTTLNFNATNCTSIGNYCWSGCTSLTTLNIGNNVQSIPNNAFKDINTLSSATIPNSVTFIGSYAFKNCSNLTSVIIPNSVTSIGDYAFYQCSGLTSIIISNSITSIGEQVFERCRGLTSITIPNSVTSIGNSAFGGCSGLTSITIPNSITSIGNSAFGSCSGLTSITIPNSVISIGDYAFYDCTGLTSIISNAINPPTIYEYTFYNANNIQDVVVPCISKQAYLNDLYWDNFGNKIHDNTRKQEICMVSVDNSNHNEIVWKKNEVLDHYNIYREGAQNGQYNLIASIPYDSSNVWIDYTSNANVRSYRYKVSGVNTEGCESDSSDFHKTMHLTIGQGIGNTWNLNWTLYEGVEFQTCNIYRTTGDSLGTMLLLENLAGNNTSYTDINAPSGYVYYVVEIVLDNPCVISKSTSSIRSNIATNNPNGVSLTDIEVSKFKIYPNPVNNKLFIDGKDYDKARIYDIIGREVLVSNKKDIDMSSLPNGIYNVRILSKDKTVSIQKIIKE